MERETARDGQSRPVFEQRTERPFRGHGAERVCVCVCVIDVIDVGSR